MLCIPDFNYLKACQSIEGTRIGKNWTDYNVSLAEISRYVDVVAAWLGFALPLFLVELTRDMHVSRRDAYKYIGKFFDFESIQLIRATGGTWSDMCMEVMAITS